MASLYTNMEIKRHIPEITAIGLAELGAGVVATKQAIDGNPMSAKELTALISFATFYAGVPAATAIRVAKDAYSWYKNTSGNK